jgi:hypothetical protein
MSTTILHVDYEETKPDTYTQCRIVNGDMTITVASGNAARDYSTAVEIARGLFDPDMLFNSGDVDNFVMDGGELWHG